MGDTININQNNNQVNLEDVNRKIVITDNKCNNVVEVLQPNTEVVEVRTPGPKGTSGTAGSSGSSGSSGTSGIAGSSGTSGQSGSSGSSGSSGVSGSSGTSGQDGAASVQNPGDNRIITSLGTSTGLLAEENMLFTGTLLSVSSSVEITGSTENDIFLIKLENGNGQDEKLKVNNEGVLILGNMNTAPTAVTGGLYYSNGSFYMGIG